MSIKDQKKKKPETQDLKGAVEAYQEEQVEKVDSADIEVEVATVVEENEVVTDGELKLMQALEAKTAENKELTDRVQRTMAEFDNFRKRTIKEKASMYESGAKDILEKILPVIDNFERALSSLSDEDKSTAVAQGVEMIYKQFMGVLKDAGVEEIEALHQEFDPNLHHAVQHEENDKYDDNLVADVYQKGYKFKETILRHSMVKVVN